MQTLVAFFHKKKGVARYATAFALGATLTLTMPPIGFFPVAMLSICGFIWMAQMAPSAWRALWLGWAYGAGFFITGLYWISAALFVDFDSFGWVLPLSLIIGPSLLALGSYAFIPLIAHRFRHDAPLHALVFVTAWAGIEWLRGHLFTGFPWNLTAYMWQHALPVVQLSALVGAYGLTLMTLLWMALPIIWPAKIIRITLKTLLVATLIVGTMRIVMNPTLPALEPRTVRIVQANIEQKMKWDNDAEWRNLEEHAKLSDKDTPADIVIWPETALTSDPVLFPEIGHYVAINMPKDSVGIFGALRVTGDVQANPDFRNGMYVMDSKGAVLGSYDKFHLVPFGEYIPMRHLLNLTPIAAGVSMIGDFVAGPGPRTLDVGGRVPPFSPLICYEVIFPGQVTDHTSRPAWLVNVTNDAWYGHTAGPYQHLEIARMRAVEEGLPLARAANTGISAMIDPVGRITASLALGERGAITTPLPMALPPTVYSMMGDKAFGILMLGALALVWLRILRLRKNTAAKAAK